VASNDPAAAINSLRNTAIPPDGIRLARREPAGQEAAYRKL